jgi:hypothetical protein
MSLPYSSRQDSNANVEKRFPVEMRGFEERERTDQRSRRIVLE